MTRQDKPPVTQRAYTLRLQGADPNEQSWRDALWQTHEAVNKGAKAFGDWLLTLRGGLDHTLADTKVKGGKGKPDRDPTAEERKARRILLALSWLSVESKLGAPEKFVIASGTEASEIRNGKVAAALEEILKSRNLAANEIGEWKNDCSASLSAAIRDDAVWINRSKAFDEAVKSIGSSLTHDEVWDILERFLGSREVYLTPARVAEDESADVEQEDKAKDLVQKAGQWLSSRFGTGSGADFSRMAEVYQEIANWAGAHSPDKPGTDAIDSLAIALSEFNPPSNDLQGVLVLISGPGYKSATRNLLKQIALNPTVTQEDLKKLNETATADKAKCEKNTGSKGQRPYADAILKDVEEACGFTYRVDKKRNAVSVADYSLYDDDYKWGKARHCQFAVMLDHAARRVSLAHTWIKRAEAERRKFEEDAEKVNQVPVAVKNWLDEFCLKRSEASGALEPYRIRRRAVDGWKEVVAAWSKSSCVDSAGLIAAARALQDDPGIDKFGDMQLFEALAEEDAKCVWHKDGNAAKAPDPQPLIDYALAAEAEFKKRRFKVPAYRHPDALLHPVFCDFGKSRWGICFDVHQKAQTPFLRALCLTLWTGSGMVSVPLRWQSKRLAHDLALGQDAQNNGASEVTRADRLGRAASNVTGNGVVKIAGLFEQKDWNGRLQAPRQQLEAIGRHIERHGWDQKAIKMRDRIRWLVTFSARLQPKGPWCEFANKHELRINPQYWPHADANKSRKGQARLILSRLPGLRVLSVDLGHRYAAACAVWEALSTDTFRKEIDGRIILRGGSDESALYCHTEHRVNGKPQTTIYRRIGSDALPDGTEHPAPWARLDRQFLIKLQGEETNARKAGPEEIRKVQEMEAALGHVRADGFLLPKQVDELMSSAARTMRLALKRHGDRARIAHYLITDDKTKPGGIKEKLDENGRVGLLQDALTRWHDLFSSRGRRDDAARQLWDDHITKLPGYKVPEEIGEVSSGPERREKQKKNREEFCVLANALAQDVTLREELHDAWKKRWEEDDKRWKKQLRWFKDWVLPRGKHASDPAIRKVGGLSLLRLATLTEFRRKIQVGFFTRLRPDGTRAETKEQFGRSALDALEHLREQRVKQLASRIAEAALGIGRMRRPMGGKDPKRPRVRVDEPCHVVVIEDLTRYRPEETRTRRENRRLMTWSSSKVKKYLSEACQLHGLHLREVSASYTSRQDSRTGAPGIRCRDVPVQEFMQSPFWRRQVAQAERKRGQGEGDARERFLRDLNAKWKDKTVADWEQAGVVRVPLRGGELFVSADPDSPAAKGLQADLNAAANIGLRALLDPDWPGKWWYVPCEPETFRPLRDKVDGCKAVNLNKELRRPVQQQSGDAATKKKKRGKRGGGKSKAVVNLWRDVSSFPLECIEFGEWEEYAAYQNEVRSRVIRVLKDQMKCHDKQPHDGSRQDDIPF